MRQNLHKAQQGLVAIFSVMIIMGILTLLTLGFSAITRQAQRRTVDDVLSTQAYYAAETGINRLKAYQSLVNGNNSTCEDTNSALDSPVFVNDIDPVNNVRISCMLVEAWTTDIRQTVRTDEAFSTFVKYDLTSDFSYWDIEWDSEDLDNLDALPTVTTPTFPNVSGWGNGSQRYVPPIRVDLLPSSAFSGASRQSLVDAWQTVYLYPTSSAAVTNTDIIPPIGVNAQSPIYMVRCDNIPFSNYRCRIRLDVIDSEYYFIRVQSFYNNASVNLTPFNTSLGNIRMEVGQMSFDSTGQAGDVQRRIQVRVITDGVSNSLDTGFHNPFALLTAETICKRIFGMPGGNTFVDQSGLPGLPPGGDPACALP